MSRLHADTYADEIWEIKVLHRPLSRTQYLGTIAYDVWRASLLVGFSLLAATGKLRLSFRGIEDKGLRVLLVITLSLKLFQHIRALSQFQRDHSNYSFVEGLYYFSEHKRKIHPPTQAQILRAKRQATSTLAFSVIAMAFTGFFQMYLLWIAVKRGNLGEPWLWLLFLILSSVVVSLLHYILRHRKRAQANDISLVEEITRAILERETQMKTAYSQPPKSSSLLFSGLTGVAISSLGLLFNWSPQIARFTPYSPSFFQFVFWFFLLASPLSFFLAMKYWNHETH